MLIKPDAQLYHQQVTATELRKLFKVGRLFRASARERLDDKQLLIQVGDTQFVAESELPIDSGDVLPVIVTSHSPQITLKLISLDDAEWLERPEKFEQLDSGRSFYLRFDFRSVEQCLEACRTTSDGSFYDSHRIHARIEMNNEMSCDVLLNLGAGRESLKILAGSSKVLATLNTILPSLRSSISRITGRDVDCQLTLKRPGVVPSKSLDLRI